MLRKCLEKLNVDAKKTPEEIIKELQDKDEKVAATQQAKGGPGAGQNNSSRPKVLQCLWKEGWIGFRSA